MKNIHKLTCLLVIIATQIIGAETMTSWPDLGGVKSISGRVATEQDINAGAAVFILQSEGNPIGKPIDILIPQYAIHTDGETGEVSKVVVIQAEESLTNGQKVIGAFMISKGEFLAGLYDEFKLLGLSVPSE